MKKLLLLSVFLAAVFITSCSRENNPFIVEPECESRKEGTLTIDNQFKSPYGIYVNNDFVRSVLGNSTVTITVKSGNSVQLNAIQESGFLLYPTKRDEKMVIANCVESTWILK